MPKEQKMTKRNMDKSLGLLDKFAFLYRKRELELSSLRSWLRRLEKRVAKIEEKQRV